MIFEIGFNLFTIIWVIFLLYCIRSCIRPKNFPTGPIILPFIGSAWTIPAKGVEFSIPKWVKKYGNTIGHKLYYEKLAIFCENADIYDGLKHPNFQGRYQSKLFMQRTRNKPLGFFFSDDETWSEVRRFTLRYFGTVFNTELETILHDELLEEFNSIRCGKITDIDGKFMKTPLNVILRILTGTHRKNYQHQIDDLQAKTEKAFIEGRVNGIELVYPISRGLFKNYIQLDAIKAAHGFLKERLEEHKQNFDELDIKDYTDAFINESKKELELYGKVVNFTDDEFLSCGIDMLQAGNESSGKTIEFLLMYVALTQRVQDELHEEIDRVVGQSRYPTLNDKIRMPYLESTIYEAMRINPISPNGVLHRVTEDTHFKGYFLEKDTLLYFAVKYAMNDPKKWKNPDEFMPERFMGGDRSKKRLPNFGLGKRSCIGEVLAKNFMFLYLAYFFQRYSIQFPSGYKPSTYPILGLTNGPQPFKLIISERKNVNRL
ncbi:farnesoate epoxidase-like isoform X2 [Planococcus citri]|uniref:farnesoate epoxidase-like isoform X2 n=1 Tax=Planococcus citri TaxID=170843 RepID=UPI0031F7510D